MTVVSQSLRKSYLQNSNEINQSMLLLLIVALIATPAFFVSAKRRGYHPGRAASTPFVALGLLLMADHFIFLLFESALSSLVTSDTVNQIILQFYAVFLGSIYLAFIARNWIVLTQTGKSASPIE